MAVPGRGPLLPLLLLLLCSLPAGTAQSATPVQPSAAPVEASSPSGVAAYRLKPADVVDIRFFQNDELNTKVTIRPDGFISMPLISQVQAAGLTVDELQTRLAELYKGTLRKPEITIQVDGFSEQRIFVGGEVARPGVMQLAGRESLLSAIFESGGLTKGANRRQATVFRRTDTGGVERIAVSLREMQNKTPGPAVSFLLKPLDVVVVHESGIAKTDRAVDQYVRQLIPAQLSGGFTYLFNNGFVP